MPIVTYIETIGVVALSIGAAITGKEYDIPFLLTTVAPGLFAAAMGYFGGVVRETVRMKNASS